MCKRAGGIKAGGKTWAWLSTWALAAMCAQAHAQVHGQEEAQHAGQPGLALWCQVRMADQVAELLALPSPDPYAPTRLVFDERFSLSATVLGQGSQVAHITLSVHDLSQDGGPVPVQQLRLQPPFASSPTLPALTGWQHVYVAPLGRELNYGCALRPAAIRQSEPPALPTASMQPVPVAQPAQGPRSEGGTVRMAWVGDVMLADGPGRLVRRGGNPFAPTAALLAQADVRVANLECVIATQGKALDKPWTFQAHPRVLPLLKKHVDVVSLANNHSGDFGQAAFAEMLQRLDAAGLPRMGGGRTLREAHQPVIIERKGVKIALLGYDEMFPRRFEAGPDWPGVAWSEDEQVAFDIRQARLKADVVIPFMHWGQEHEPRAHARQRQLARMMIDAGADAVVGTHPHVVQDLERYRGKPIFYSLGNFVFDGFSSRDNNTGWVLWLDVTRQGVQGWHIDEVRQDRQGTPRPVRRTAQPAMPEASVGLVSPVAP